MMPPVGTDGWTDLVFHLLAHVPLSGPHTLYDPRYVTWARRWVPADDQARVEHDAKLIAQGVTGSLSRSARLQALPELFKGKSLNLDDFRRVSDRPFAQLTKADVADPLWLAALQRDLPVVMELVHATLGLLVSAFETLHREQIAPAVDRAIPSVRPWIDAAASIRPTLASTRIEFSWPLGLRGRAMPGRILVGCPTPFNELDPITPAIVALHEQAVVDSDSSDDVHAEWAALKAVAQSMQHAPVAMGEAHARWLASMEFGGLLEQVVDTGLASDAVAAELRRAPETRQALLAQLK